MAVESQSQDETAIKTNDSGLSKYYIHATQSIN